MAQQRIEGRVDLAFNRFYDYDEMTQALQDLAAAYPELLTLESIGQSVQGREMWLVTLNNPATGSDTVKPGMYIDANIHGNEVQGTEVVLYSIWYLCKAYGEVDQITELVDRTAFYFVPTVNPDSRAHWFAEPNTSSSQRSGQHPLDNDYDGTADEDPAEDLDGDGHIGRMYRYDPAGRFKLDPDDPTQIVLADDDDDPSIRLSSVGSEGIDNDGDGRTNEDGEGGYDMNRNWPAGWQPNYIQRGAGDYPLCWPETRCVADFILTKPNIAAVQSYHNSGGMILRGPGQENRENLYPRADDEVYDRLGAEGEQILPYYRYMIIWSDLYAVHGGTVNWTGETLGIISFTNELWSGAQISQRMENGISGDDWDKRVLFGQTLTPYTEHDHPTYGKVLIGGNTKWSSRTPPNFMLEEECHRNFAFTMHHAAETPEVKFKWIGVTDLGDGLWQVDVEVENENVIPTRTAIAAQRGIGVPDRLSLRGAGTQVVLSGEVDDRLDETIDDPVEHRRHTLYLERGIGSESSQMYRFLVTGTRSTDMMVSLTMEKARDIETTFELREGETTFEGE